MRAILALLFLVPISACVDTTPTASSKDSNDHPEDPRNFTWVVEDRLAVGGGGLSDDDVRFLADAGFEAVANFRAENEDPTDLMSTLGIEHLYVPVVHGTDINASQLRSYVAWQQEMDALGKKTYIHCTNGWHRAATFAVAYEMNETGMNYDALADRATARRPGSVIRGMAALLEYQQELIGQPGLHVLLQSNQSRPFEGDETMPVQAYVFGPRGEPIDGARVRVWSEGRRFETEGTTGPDGVYRFDYRAPANSTMAHLNARASLSGLLDGADTIEIFFRSSTTVHKRLDAFVTPQPHGLDVELVAESGQRVRGRALAREANDSFVLQRTGTGRTFLDLPMDAFPIEVQGVSWGATPATTMVVGTPRFHAAFVPHGGNEWWREVRVGANEPLERVEVRVGAEPWRPMAPQSDGDWTGTAHAEAGAAVRFRATSITGAPVESPCFDAVTEQTIPCT